KSTWQVGDEVGVYVVVKDGTLSATASENFLHNVKLTYNGTTWQPEEKLYWPNTGGTFDFYAYFPYSASATDPANIAF
ncbi:MAG: fimbrillin family protein, partial [Planctomycetia bacterium]|nr:fimbrillin family protein [Planctomycetia bacterium]